jgi:fluoroacetyl-CoA thioesterase
MLIEGSTADRVLRVTAEMTAAAGGNDGVDVFATPNLLFLLENTCVDVLAPSLRDGQLSVGTHLDVEHLAPTPVGMAVSAHARLTRIDGRRLVFDVRAEDGVEVVARGTHTRVVLDADRFRGRCAAKAASTGQENTGDGRGERK